MLGVVVGSVPSELAVAGNHAMAGAALYTNQPHDFHMPRELNVPCVLSNNLELEVTRIHPWLRTLSTRFNLHK